MKIWMLEPVGELEFGGDVSIEPDHDLYRIEPIGPVQIRVRWDGRSPETAEGEIFGDPVHARSLDGPRGNISLVGRLLGGRTATVRDVFFTTVYTSQTHEYGPRLLAKFIAGDVEVRAKGKATDAELRSPEVLFHIPDDPVWLGFTGRFGFEPNDPVEAPWLKLDARVRDLRIETTHLVFSGGAEFGGRPGRGQRISLAVRVTAPDGKKYREIDTLVASAESAVSDLLLLAGLAARRPFHVLGGHADAVHDTADGRVYEAVEFTRSRTRHQVRRGRSFNDVQIEQDAYLKFLESGLRTLATDPRAEFLRLAIQSYVSSLYRAFDTQQFLSVCTVIEAIKEWHSRNNGWHKLTSEKQQSAVRDHVDAALIEAAKKGHLPGQSHVEARAKVAELFRPRISTILNELVDELQIPVDDLFERDTSVGPRGPYVFNFLNVRNKLVHQGKPPEDRDQFHDISTRTRYFAERLLFTVLGFPPRGFLKLQYELPKPRKAR